MIVLAGPSASGKTALCEQYSVVRWLSCEDTLTLEVLSGERGSAASLLALLPAEFTTADLIKLRARKRQSVKNNAICMVLNRWKTNNKITKINESTWKKL